VNRRGAFASALACAVAVTSLAGCGDSGLTSAELFGYQTVPESNQITVVYGARPGDKPGTAEVLEQGPAHVKVRVRYERSNQPQDDMLLRKQAVATLLAPLGERKVLNEAGVEIPRQ